MELWPLLDLRMLILVSSLLHVISSGVIGPGLEEWEKQDACSDRSLHVEEAKHVSEQLEDIVW